MKDNKSDSHSNNKILLMMMLLIMQTFVRCTVESAVGTGSW